MFASVAPIVREALLTLWKDKRLWFFGFFVAAGAGGGAQIEVPGVAPAALPTWALGLLAVGGVLGFVHLFLHVLGEGALIHLVRRQRDGERIGLREAWVAGWRAGRRVFGVKLLATTWSVLALGVAATPLVLGLFEVIPLALAIALLAPLLAVVVPTIVTVYLVQEVALRLVVLEGRGVLDGWRAARLFLRGRLAHALGLIVSDAAAQVVAGLVAAPVALLALGLGYLVSLTGGIAAGITVGLVLALPVAVIVVGARGTFRSALWTLAVLEERPTA